MTTTETTTKHADQAKDHDLELERAIRDALMLAVGKRAANQALRHARSRAHRPGRRRLGRVAAHLATYGALGGYIWRQRRKPA
jgi:hypothetical protein